MLAVLLWDNPSLCVCGSHYLSFWDCCKLLGDEKPEARFSPAGPVSMVIPSRMTISISQTPWLSRISLPESFEYRCRGDVQPVRHQQPPPRPDRSDSTAPSSPQEREIGKQTEAGTNLSTGGSLAPMRSCIILQSLTTQTKLFHPYVRPQCALIDESDGAKRCLPLRSL